MNQIISFFQSITTVQIIDIWVAIGIIIFFRIFSSAFSYAIIKMFKFKEKNSKKIKQGAFYNPLRIFFIILGFYLAIIFLKQPLNISKEVMNVVTKIFKIVSIIVFARGIAESFSANSALVKKMKKHIDKNIEDSMFQFILKTVRAIIYIIAGFMVITELGFNLNGLVAGLGVSGVIVTLAAQDTAKNLFGGLVIFLDKPFVVGDWIQMGEYEGTVEDITFRSTRIRTFENALVNIPNSVISSASITNWSKMEKRRYRTNLCLAQDTPLEKLEIFKKRVNDMLQARDAIFDDSIIVKFDTIADNGLNVLICSYTDSVDYPSYLSEREDINCKIMKILKEENIELAYDTKTVYLKQ